MRTSGYGATRTSRMAFRAFRHVDDCIFKTARISKGGRRLSITPDAVIARLRYHSRYHSMLSLDAVIAARRSVRDIGRKTCACVTRPADV